jgi:hypothetical protein
MDYINFSVKNQELAIQKFQRTTDLNPENSLNLNLEPITRKDVVYGGYTLSESQMEYDLILYNFRNEPSKKRVRTTSVRDGSRN